MRGSRHPSSPAVGYQSPSLSVTGCIQSDSQTLAIETASQCRHVHPFATFGVTKVKRIGLLIYIWLPFILLVVLIVILTVVIVTSRTAAIASCAEFVKQLPVAQSTGNKLYGNRLSNDDIFYRYRRYYTQVVLN